MWIRYVVYTNLLVLICRHEDGQSGERAVLRAWRGVWIHGEARLSTWWRDDVRSTTQALSQPMYAAGLMDFDSALP